MSGVATAIGIVGLAGAYYSSQQSKAALNQANNQYNQAQQQQNNAIANQQWQNQVADTQASSEASALRSKTAIQNGANFTNTAGLGFGPGAATGSNAQVLGSNQRTVLGV